MIFQISMCYGKEVIFFINSLHEAEQNNNQEAIFISLCSLVTQIAQVITEKQSTIISKDLEKLVLVSIKTVKKTISNPSFQAFQNRSQMKTIEEVIMEHFFTINFLNEPKSYHILWMTLVKLVTCFFRSDNILKWGEAIQPGFLITGNLTDNEEKSEMLILKFKNLVTYMLKCKKDVISFWWEIVATYLLVIFVPYPVIINSEIISPKNIYQRSCDLNIKDIVTTLLKSPIIQESFEMKKQSPNEPIAILSFLSTAYDPSLDLLVQWYGSIWISVANDQYQNSKLFSMMRLYAQLCPSILITLIEIITKAILIISKNDRQVSFYAYINILTKIITGPIRSLNMEPNILREILFVTFHEINYENPNLAALLFLYFTFELKFSSKSIWDRFLNELILTRENLIICGKFISLISIAFSPLFFGFKREDIENYFTTLNQRKERNNEKVIPVKIYLQIFDNYYQFSKVLQSEHFEELNVKFEEIFKNDKISFIETMKNEFDYQGSWEYFVNILHSFPAKKQYSLYVSILMSLTSIQQIIPIKLIKNRRFTWDNIISKILNYMLFHKVTTDAYNITFLTVNFMGVTIKEEKNADLFIELLIKLLCMSKTSNIINMAVEYSIRSILMFSHFSHTLIPFIFSHQNDLTISSENLHNFMSSSYTLLKSQDKLELPPKLYEHIKLWKNVNSKKQAKEFLNQSIYYIEHYDELVFKYFLFLNAQKISFPILVSNLISQLFIKIKMTISLNDTILNYITKSLDNIDCYSFRSLSFLSDYSWIFIDENFDFFFSFVKFVSMNSDNMELLKYVFEMIYNNKKLLLLFLSIMKSRNIKLKSINYLPFNFYNETLFTNIILNDSDFIFSTQKSQIGSIRTHEESFDFYCRNFTSYISYNIEALKTKNEIGEPIELIPIPESSDEEINDKFNDEQCTYSINTKIQNMLTNIFGNQENVEIQDFEPKEISYNEIEIETKEENIEHFKDDDEKTTDYSLLISKTRNCFPSFMFLNQLMIFDSSSLRIKEYVNQNKAFLETIFNSSTKEQIKIGVLYVKDNQFEQNDIFGNEHENSSEQYKQFIESLGTIVDIEKHKKYRGKLSPSDGKGVYYTNNSLEVIFHVSTLLNDSTGDVQKISKKRHIGNDNVHIIWCENPAGYDTSSISSQFNDIHIIIFPNGEYYRVTVHKKNPDYKYFPLPQDSLVDPKSLGYLIRSTAIIADRYVRKSNSIDPYKDFKQIISEFFSKS